MTDGTIALRDGEDRWTRAAVLSGIGGRIDEFRAALQREEEAAKSKVVAFGGTAGRKQA